MNYGEQKMLSIKNLTHTYPNGKQALKNINLDVPKGMFGLLGPNGAGKSTLMRTLATLQQPSEGAIGFVDINIINNPDKIRKTLGYLPQEFGVYPRGSASNLLNHLAVLKGLTDKKQRKGLVDDLLQQTNLYEVRNKHVSTFSGGMRQRFGIAQALIGKPKLIIVDEPTAGLDPEERNRFHNLLSEIGEEVVVILSTHIVADVADLCPNMAILADGEIVIKGTPKGLIHQLQGQIWKKIIDKSKLEEYQNNYHVISHHLSEGQRIIRVKCKTLPEIGFETATANLEDVYFLAIDKNHNPAELLDDNSNNDKPTQIYA